MRGGGGLLLTINPPPLPPFPLALPFGEQRLLVRSVEKMAEYGRLSSGPCGCQGDDDDDAQEDDNDDSGAGAAARAGVGGAGGFLPEHFDPANCLPPHDELNTRLPPPPPSPPPTPPPTPPPNSDRQTLYAHRRAKMRYSQFYNQRRVGVPLALLPPTVYDAVVVANSSACPVRGAEGEREGLLENGGISDRCSRWLQDIADIRRIARVRQMHRHIAACETGDELSRFLPDVSRRRRDLISHSILFTHMGKLLIRTIHPQRMSACCMRREKRATRRRKRRRRALEGPPAARPAAVWHPISTTTPLRACSTRAWLSGWPMSALKVGAGKGSSRFAHVCSA